MKRVTFAYKSSLKVENMKKILIALLCLTTCIFAAGLVGCAKDAEHEKQSAVYGEDDGDWTDNY